MNIFQPKTKFVIIYAVILSSLILSLMLIKRMFISQTETPGQNKPFQNKIVASPIPITPTIIPEKYLMLDDASASAVLVAVNPNNNKIKYKAFLYSAKPITLPALLSDYDAILVANNSSGNNFNPMGESFSPSYVGQGVDYEANVLVGKKYFDEKGIIRANLKPNGGPAISGDSGIQIFAHNEEMFTKLLVKAEKMRYSDYQDTYNQAETILPKQVIKSVNYTDPDHPYTYFLPAKYKSQISPQGYPNTYFASSDQDNICLSFKEDHNDPCGFSTSGCTCCNTGCELLDYVIFATRDGIVRIDPIMQKGKDKSGGTRFVYDAPHPWLYYTATYSSPNNNPQGVLDLIYLVDSMDRNY